MDKNTSPETLNQALILFATDGMPARNLSTRTRNEYFRDLSDLIAFLEERGLTTLTQVGLTDLVAYQAEMDRKKYKASSRERKSYAIKSFFGWLEEQGYVLQDISKRLIPPDPQKREPRFLSKQEYTRLLREVSHNPRDAAIVEVFLQTGMRLSELAGLRLMDIELPKKITQDPDNTGRVEVRRKGGKIETIPLNYKACQALAAYLKVRPTVNHDGLFVSKFKTKISPRAIQYTISHYLEEAGISNASVHTLRHTMATHHAAQGTNIKVVQEMLGHARLETTGIYVNLAKKAQRQALQEHAL